MSNMSYCRFENTLGDLQDCEGQLEALFNADGADKIPTSNDRERSARVQLIELCQTIAEMVEDYRTGSGREGWTVEQIVEDLEKHDSAEEGDDE